jgi:translocator protein
MNDSLWYLELIRPTWAPPSWIFGPVWTVLYLIIAVTYGYIAWAYIQKKIPSSVALPFLVNIISNLLFTPLQFGLQNNLLAAIDISIILLSIIWMFRAIYVFEKKQAEHYSRSDRFRDISIRGWQKCAGMLMRVLPLGNTALGTKIRRALRMQYINSYVPRGYRWIIYANIPYLLWVCFATVLQFTITYLNW